MLCLAEAPIGELGSSGQPSNSSESRKSLQKIVADSVDTQSEAFNICLRATKRFEKQEKDKETGKTAIASLSASCKTELKPASYWLCMEKEAIAEVDFNAAHWRCAKTLNH
jgi:hypothetical protein